MKTSIKSFGALILLAVATQAAPLTLIFTGIGSGVFDGIPFEGTDFVITGFGDTNDVTASPTGYRVALDSATIELEGFGTFSFLAATRAFVNQVEGAIGFGRSEGDLYNFSDMPESATWGLKTPYGPESGSNSRLIQWDFFPPVATPGGDLLFDTAVTEGTFEAIVGPVPEPASWGLILLGLAAILGRYSIRKA